MRPFMRFLLIVTLAGGVAACSGGRDVSAPLIDDNDPLEGFNRSMFSVNMTLDKYVVKPVAKGYLFVPQPARTGLRNFLNNLASPITLANDLLQGEASRAGTTTARLGINTTLGVLGLFDVAKRFGLERHEEDFGQTLGVYGVGEGPYLFFPLLGPRPPRDFAGMFVDSVFDPMTYIADDNLTGTLIRYTLDGIDLRAANLTVLDEIERSSVDFYASVRSLYRQNRASAINNGATNLDELPDLDELDNLDADF